jgi:hypothetical protein
LEQPHIGQWITVEDQDVRPSASFEHTAPIAQTERCPHTPRLECLARRSVAPWRKFFSSMVWTVANPLRGAVAEVFSLCL